MSAEIKRRIFRINEVAGGILPFTRPHIYRMIRRGDLDTVVISGIKYVTATSIDKLIKSESKVAPRKPRDVRGRLVARSKEEGAQ